MAFMKVKKRAWIAFLAFSLLAVALFSGCATERGGDLHGGYPSTYGGDRHDGDVLPPLIACDDLSIHFLELGNKYTGDCVYIQYGDIDILIDAGSRQNSALAIRAYIDRHLRDNKLEFVIATHGHQDHIAGFYSTRNIAGVLDSYDIGTIIDFPLTNSGTLTLNNYEKARDDAVARGAAHYNALQCYNNEDGAQREYDLGGGVRLEILYNYFYDHVGRNENNYSVCIKLICNDQQYLFTGDLEMEGEDYLVDYYEENFGGLGHCVLYKGGHHGSSTSSGEKLLAAITPEYVCVCTCAGTSEYSLTIPNQFPTQAFIDRVAPYTDMVYITTLIINYTNNEFAPFNGDIVFFVSQGNVSVRGSGSSKKLKESEWFLAYREMPAAWMGDFP